MQTSNVHEWIEKDANRKEILAVMALPMTPMQVAVTTGIPLNICSYTLAKFFVKKLAICFNPHARNNRVYMLSELGKEFKNFFSGNSSPPQNSCDIPNVDWELYGWLCYSHRSAIIKVLDRPMRPSEIKRSLRLYRPDVKISANNVRDVMKSATNTLGYRTKGITQPAPDEMATLIGNALVDL